MSPVTDEKIRPSCLEIKVFGKITGIEQIKGKTNPFYATRLVIPAADQYTKPIQLQINSKLPFGSEGDIVDTIVYVRPQWRSNEGNWYFSCNLWKDKPDH